jgi:WD40 repeat protein
MPSDNLLARSASDPRTNFIVLASSRSIDSTLKLWNINNPRTPLQTFIGHENKMRFTGVDSAHELIACGSETNSVIAYAKPLGSPAFTHSFNSTEVEKVCVCVCQSLLIGYYLSVYLHTCSTGV